MQYPGKAIVMRQGEPSTQVLLIRSGWLKVTSDQQRLEQAAKTVKQRLARLLLELADRQSDQVYTGPNTNLSSPLGRTRDLLVPIGPTTAG